MLKQYLRQRREQKNLLLMTHIVLGYPSFDDSLRIVESMVESGVDLMELQIPFSEPMADGPVILRANADALRQGATVEKCFQFAERVAKEFDIPFLFMTYYNILYQYGVTAFAERMKEIGMQGAIVPDLPPEEGTEYLKAMSDNSQAPIFIYSPNSSAERMKMIAELADGFIYCVARKGVTGQATSFSDQLDDYLARCQQATDLPLALGFGVKSNDDMIYLRNKVDIAVVGSETIRIVDEQGVGAVGPFIKGLQKDI